jgi:hypothetical protein
MGKLCNRIINTRHYSVSKMRQIGHYRCCTFFPLLHLLSPPPPSDIFKPAAVVLHILLLNETIFFSEALNLKHSTLREWDMFIGDLEDVGAKCKKKRARYICVYTKEKNKSFNIFKLLLVVVVFVVHPCLGFAIYTIDDQCTLSNIYYVFLPFRSFFMLESADAK